MTSEEVQVEEVAVVDTKPEDEEGGAALHVLVEEDEGGIPAEVELLGEDLLVVMVGLLVLVEAEAGEEAVTEEAEVEKVKVTVRALIFFLRYNCS